MDHQIVDHMDMIELEEMLNEKNQEELERLDNQESVNQKDLDSLNIIWKETHGKAEELRG